MSCSTGDYSCDVPRRRSALLVLGAMTVIFLLLSVFSFVDSRGQTTPDEITYAGYTADAGKRVFQAYNCMGCHTIVGNGAYLGPDLTKEYKKTGSAWLEAFLPSAGSWPTTAAVRTHLNTPEQLAAAGVDSMDAYLRKYPGAAERLERRGGNSTHMPNLPFTQAEVGQLIAFLKYTSAMNTEGWPPEVRSGGLDKRAQLIHGPGVTATTAAITSTVESGSSEPAIDDKSQPKPAELGKKLASDMGCVACHAADKTRKVGPGWGDLYGSQIKLDNGNTISADETYLKESIRDPNAKVVAGYAAGVMPAYDDSMLSDAELDAILAYLVSLSSSEK